MTVPLRLQDERDAGDEVVEVGHLREDVVAAAPDRPACRSAASSVAFATPKNDTSVGTPFVDRDLGDVRRRLDAEARDAALDEVLEQVAVVARELDDEAVLVEPRDGR